MPGVGASGGYGPPLNTLGMSGIEYPPGPAGWTAGKDWSQMPGSVFRAADLNQQLSLPLDYLTNAPMFQAIQQVPQSIPAASAGTTVFLNLNLDSPLVDPWGMWGADTGPSRFIVPAGMDGVYLMSAAVPVTVKAANFSYDSRIALSNSFTAPGQSTIVAASSGQVMMQVTDLGVCQEGDYFQLLGGTSSTTAVPTVVTTGTGNTPSVSAVLSARWVASNPAVTPLPEGYSFPLSPPSPAAWTAGQDLTSADLNSQIRDAVVFLANRPFTRVVTLGGQSIPNAAVTAITTMVPDPGPEADPWGSWSGSVWTAPVGGLYLCVCKASCAPNTSAYTAYPVLTCVQSGVTASYSGGKSSDLFPAGFFMRTIRLGQGDTVTPCVYQAAGKTMGLSESSFCALWLRP